MTITANTLGTGLSGARWRLAETDPALLAKLKELTGEDEIVLQCLLNRGIHDPGDIKQFLAPDFFADSHDPMLLRDMEHAVARLRDAVAKGEKILVVTDFDVDGTTSSIIISSALKLIGGGALIESYIPDRFSEGYGLSRSIVEYAATSGFRLIVTADIGIKSHAEATLARERGIDLIICDHHLPDGEDVPADAFAVLCPKGSSGEGYPNKHLAACGVALKLASALLREHPKRDAILSSLGKLTAIGTVADMVDLSTRENRAFVSGGLRSLGEGSTNFGLNSLLEVAKVGTAPSTYDVGFKIGPRINAAGRIQHANLVLGLFNATAKEKAMEFAKKLDELNAERQQIQRGLVDQLLEQVEQMPQPLERVLVFAGEESAGYHRGVVGIACSKIVEKFGRPTLICSITDDGMARGSARSVAGFHIVQALESVGDLLEKFGGHPMAAGFSLKREKIDEFRYRLNRHAAEVLSDEDLGRTLTADAILRLEQVNLQFIKTLGRLEPHGIGNPSPLFLVEKAEIRRFEVIKDTHLKLVVGRHPATLEAVWFNASEYEDQLRNSRYVDLMCKPELNEWNGLFKCQLRIVDAAPC
jgi:single-stranded-DNA-specific exonuclease